MAEVYFTIPIKTLYVTLEGEEYFCGDNYSRVLDRFHNEEVFPLQGCRAMITKLELVGGKKNIQLRAHVRALRSMA